MADLSTNNQQTRIMAHLIATSLLASTTLACGLLNSSPEREPGAITEKTVSIVFDEEQAQSSAKQLGLNGEFPQFIALAAFRGDRSIAGGRVEKGLVELTLPVNAAVELRGTVVLFRDTDVAERGVVFVSRATQSVRIDGDTDEIGFAFAPYQEFALTNVYGLVHEDNETPAEGAKVFAVDPYTGVRVAAEGLDATATTDAHGAYSFAMYVPSLLSASALRMIYEHKGADRSAEVLYPGNGLRGVVATPLNLSAPGDAVTPNFQNKDDWDEDGTSNTLELTNGTNPFSALSGARGADGFGAGLITSEILPGSSLCPAGGRVYTFFQDRDNNGVQDPEEPVTSSQHICHGVAGAQGAAGARGADGKQGADGVAGRDGAAGRDGINGTNGIDGRDGTDGTDGADGADGVSVNVSATALAIGSADCPAGGYNVTFYRDENDNGVQDAGDTALSSSAVCHGADGTGGGGGGGGSANLAGVALLEGKTEHAGIQVTLNGSGYTTTTDNSGYYTLSLPAGTYTGGLTFSKSGYQSTTRTEAFTLADSQTRAIADVTLVATHNDVAGVITVNGLNDHSGTVVRCVANGATATTTATGAFVLTGVPLGSQTLQIERSGALNQTVNITVASGPVLNIGAFTVSVTNGEVRGTVTLNGLSNHSGVTVRLVSNPSVQTQTSVSGGFALGPVPDGSAQQIVIERSGWSSQTSTSFTLTPLESRALGGFTLTDTIAPTITSVAINSNASTTASTAAMVSVQAQDDGSGVKLMQISTDGTFDTEPWYTYSSGNTPVTLPAGDGLKTVSVRVKDGVGNMSTTATDDINLSGSTSGISGVIATNTTWNLAGSPYVVTEHALVDTGVTLTIEPGVEVRFTPGKYLRVDGTLVAEGTAANPISFVCDTTECSSDTYLNLGSASAQIFNTATGVVTGGTRLSHIFVERLELRLGSYFHVWHLTFGEEARLSGSQARLYFPKQTVDQEVSLPSGSTLYSADLIRAHLSSGCSGTSIGMLGGTVSTFRTSTFCGSAAFLGARFNEFIDSNLWDSNSATEGILQGSAFLDLSASTQAVLVRMQGGSHTRIPHIYWPADVRAQMDTSATQITRFIDFYDDFNLGKLFYTPHLSTLPEFVGRQRTPAEVLLDRSQMGLSNENDNTGNGYGCPATTSTLAFDQQGGCQAYGGYNWCSSCGPGGTPGFSDRFLKLRTYSATQFRISDGDPLFAGAAWQTFQHSIPAPLPDFTKATSGPHINANNNTKSGGNTFWVQFRDSSGNTSIPRPLEVWWSDVPN